MNLYQSDRKKEIAAHDVYEAVHLWHMVAGAGMVARSNDSLPDDTDDGSVRLNSEIRNF